MKGEPVSKLHLKDLSTDHLALCNIWPDISWVLKELASQQEAGTVCKICGIVLQRSWPQKQNAAQANRPLGALRTGRVLGGSRPNSIFTALNHARIEPLRSILDGDNHQLGAGAPDLGQATPVHQAFRRDACVHFRKYAAFYFRKLGYLTINSALRFRSSGTIPYAQ